MKPLLPAMRIEDAAVVLHLRIRVREANREAFLAYIRDAFPVFEAAGGCRGVVYAVDGDPEAYDEVFYYATEADYQAGERAIHEDPVQVALLARWRALLEGPPHVEVQRPLPLSPAGERSAAGGVRGPGR